MVLTLLPPLLINTSVIFPKTLSHAVPPPPKAGPFYLKWVDADETTFGPEHHFMDEYVFSVQRSLVEGEMPLLEIEMENPREGLLSPDRQYHIWFAWDNGSEIVPLFFGSVVGTPDQIDENVISVQFIAKPANYKYQRQKLAETMKVLPWWDPVWIEPSKRDDPDKILEAYGKFWDVDPVTGVVTAVGFTEGPDGNVDITEDDHFHNSVDVKRSQPPATAILMDASVSWTQSYRGVVDLGNHSVTSYGDAIKGDWPRPLSQIGGGYSVFTSFAEEISGTDASDAVTISYSWQSKAKKHENGDTMSISFSQTLPMGPVGASVLLTMSSQTGVVDPFAVDSDGDPSPLNIPMTYNETTAHAMTYTVNTSLVVEYVAERQRTERVIFMIRADTQPVLYRPSIDEESETITMVGADVGAPILNLLNWTTVSGEHVEVGQVVFPDDPQLPGGRTAQIVTVEGDVGTTPPEFSDIPGEDTISGTATFTSLGQAAPPENAGDWYADSPINKGTIILPRRPFYVPYNVLIAPGLHAFPPKGTSVHEGLIAQFPDGFYVCTEGGTTTSTGAAGSVVWSFLGTKLPSGSTYFICTNDGQSGAKYMIPQFNETLHSVTVDNGVEWTCIGTGDIPIGGVVGNTPSPTYFCLDRGHRSTEYLGLIVRAKLLWRARCVDVVFETDWNTGIAITTRKTVTLHNPKLPGGIALGKVKSAILSFSDRGGAICVVTIGCTVGKDNAVSEVVGDPTYVTAGYVTSGYQKYDSAVVLLPTGSDLAYTPPTYRITDDGLVFPLTRSQIVLVDEVRTIGDQEAAVKSALNSMAEAAQTQTDFRGGGNVFESAFATQMKKKLLAANSVSVAITENPKWIEYQLKPASGGPFNSVVNVKFSDFTIVRGIDLQAEAVS